MSTFSKSVTATTFVYLNRKRLFPGKNALTYRDDRALGVFGISDEIPIHLQPGENELLVAVTEYNGGWAFQCELHPVGVKARKVMCINSSRWR